MEPHSGARLTAGKVTNDNNMNWVREFAGLASDSRAVKPGYLFAALPGSKDDGARFIPDAVKRGAVAVLARPEAAGMARGVHFIADENPRARLAKFAAAFYGAQPSIVAAVTGTNGKTSVAVFLRQIWQTLGHPSASMGTIGVVTPTAAFTLAHTTPDPIEVHALLAELKREGVEHLALEASSHGLDQYRLDGVQIAAGAFTNITRDHLDYHASFEAYLAAKLRLFTEVLHADGVAVINVDAEHAEEFLKASETRGLRILTVGETGDTLRLVTREPFADGQRLGILYDGQSFDVSLPLAGSFQASNALVAAGLAIALGDDAAKVFAALEHLKGAPGRLEKVATAKSGAPIYVDYAHTPDALETVLTALRPHVTGKLYVIFGCGGDRDKGKRPLMGKAAAAFADRVILTDDNPRSEDAAAIRAQAHTGCPDAEEIGDRATAIRAGITALQSGDALIIAGKGHESGQIVGTVVHPFSDRDKAIEAALSLGGKAPKESKGEPA
jgi:UDP-N-acetylmuramoyl-L-alanyl-D-glutamate--2,6-diaminopimelate ligase